MLRWAIIGCGLIGKKRAATLAPGSLRWVCDTRIEAAEALRANHPECRATTDPAAIFADPEVDAVIVATWNHTLAPLALAAVQAGKHVIVEKPGALHSSQLIALRAAANTARVRVLVAYNHRWHPALHRAREIVAAGTVGDLMFLRGRYGHGGRLGYEKEWRADPALSGGGELIDQGVHLIDLANWFLGDFAEIEGRASTDFWEMPVDDNAFLHLRTATGRTAWLHVSCSEWKNLFSLEIYGRTGKLQVDGLGGSYGIEKLTYYRMLPQMGPPEIETWEFPQGDNSWALELHAFERAIAAGRDPSPNLDDSIRVLEIVEEIYRRSGYAFPAPLPL